MIICYAFFAAEARAFGATRFELHAALAELGRRSTEANNPAAAAVQLEDSLWPNGSCASVVKIKIPFPGADTLHRTGVVIVHVGSWELWKKGQRKVSLSLWS